MIKHCFRSCRYKWKYTRLTLLRSSGKPACKEFSCLSPAEWVGINMNKEYMCEELWDLRKPRILEELEEGQRVWTGRDVLDGAGAVSGEPLLSYVLSNLILKQIALENWTRETPWDFGTTSFQWVHVAYIPIQLQFND